MSILGWKFDLYYWRIALGTFFHLNRKSHKKNLDLQLKVAKSLAQAKGNAEKQRILAWLKKNEIQPFPYDFPKKYKKSDVRVLYDEQAKCYYGFWHGKKVYVKKTMNKREAQGYLCGIAMEQDEASPHLYRYEKANIAGKVIADVGAAEGFFSLDVIDDAKKVYLFECDPEWIDALKLTFAPWRAKVEIVEKYVDQTETDTSVTIDSFFAGREIDILKADIEGYEVPMLRGATKSLPRISNLIVCAYHKQRAEQEIRNILSPFSFKISTSSGYMFFMADEEQFEPYVRRGLIYATK